MLARGIRSYHRPTRLEEALDLAAQGIVPVAGGTRLLAAPIEVPNLLDLSALGLAFLRLEDEDLELGALTSLQDVIDSPAAHAATAGLLPAACRAQSPSRMLRGMATLGGEAVHADPDSEVVAALLALNAVFLVSRHDEPRESPALRFLRSSADDLSGGGLLRAILIPGAPDGAALERVSVLPSAPPLVAAAVTVTFTSGHCSRARIALSGLDTPPARVLEAETQLERTAGGASTLDRAAEQAAALAPFRDDAHASAGYRRRVARVLVRRALRQAVAQAKRQQAPRPPRARPALPQRAPTAMPYFTSGRIELSVNSRPVRGEAEARTSLLDFLRREGFTAAKSGCETGQCGACTVLLDGRPTLACLTLALRAQGHAVSTAEAAGAAAPNPAQRAFAGALQCGFCTPALQLSARALLDAFPDPTEEEAQDALAGSLCRCVGHARRIRALLAAARA